MHLAARPWEEAWADALYGPRGFYRQHAPAEHFATTVQGIPGAGAILAEAVVILAARHGAERIVDVAAGRGELLAHLRQQAPGLHLTGVDVVACPDGLDVDCWLVAPGGAQLPDQLRGLEKTLVIAHEWLDVVPAPVVERDLVGPPDQVVWRVLTVDPHGVEARAVRVEGEDLSWLERWVPSSVIRAEVGRPRDLAWLDLLSRVETGLVIAIDYGHTFADRPVHGTFTGFRRGREVLPLPDGSCDLTAHVAVDSLAAGLSPAGAPRTTPPMPTTGPPITPTRDVTLPTDPGQCHVLLQRDVLRDLLDVTTASPVPHELARTRPTAYLEAVARRSALLALTAPGGLGGFHWVMAVRG
ncbi:MAG: SAM-dependent methyltransferase [Ornithinimicrobium sp.]|uniref:SAM-dependent methyltransferase n=1 Tax=Ornithinimicrobium sp. TaxID=1977084 RepID=UPI0026E01AA5|nr:SAM-dependent methyltransferase [Ornithinimicrobium sp.]MDO5739196.1 SAM-dependent methyltransferase [Ornithinimicrobium sp.]